MAHLGAEASRLKETTSHAVEGAIAGGKRLAVRGRHAAEQLANDTAERVKADPLRSLAATFAVGLGVGLLAAGCVAWRKGVTGRRSEDVQGH